MSEFLKIRVNDAQSIYFGHIAAKMPVVSSLLGVKELYPPFYAAQTLMHSYGGKYCLETFLIGSERILTLPGAVRNRILPAPPSIFQNYNINATQLRQNSIALLDEAGEPEYDIDFGIENPENPLFILHASFGLQQFANSFKKIDPDIRWAIDFNNSRMKKYLSVPDFSGELKNYAHMLECLVNGFYRDLKASQKEVPGVASQIGDIYEPVHPKMLTWSNDLEGKVVPS